MAQQARVFVVYCLAPGRLQRHAATDAFSARTRRRRCAMSRAVRALSTIVSPGGQRAKLLTFFFHRVLDEYLFGG